MINIFKSAEWHIRQEVNGVFFGWASQFRYMDKYWYTLYSWDWYKEQEVHSTIRRLYDNSI